MNIDSYQEFTRTTAIYPKEKELEYLTLGLAGEAGEVAGKVSKIIRDRNGIPSEEDQKLLKKELGDNLWFIARLADYLGVKISDLLQENVDKLKSRQARGVLGGDGDLR